jgi:hypothetical protein
MHLLSAQIRDEFLAVPQLIRLDYVACQNGREPTLLVKSSTLLLKYVVSGARMQLAFALFDGNLLCALRVCDDGDQGGVLWSVLEHEQELNCIRGLAGGQPLVAFLFNELAVNVAWNDFSTLGTSDRLATLIKSAVISRVDYSTLVAAVHPMLDQLHQSGRSNSNWLTFEIGGRSDWKPVKSHFITAGASDSLIDIFDKDEGNQQEQFGIWLTDNLQSAGAYHRPQIQKCSRTRELTDILLSYEFGAVFIESKTLSILARERLPERGKLKRDIAAHIGKAFAQLRGAIRALNSGVPVTNANGDTLNIERAKPVHAIVLVPDLELVDVHTEFGAESIRDFVKTTGGFPHLLDISELLRIVQAAEMIAARGKTTTPMMAFDYYLIERLKIAIDAGTLCIEVLLRFDG